MVQSDDIEGVEHKVKTINELLQTLTPLNSISTMSSTFDSVHQEWHHPPWKKNLVFQLNAVNFVDLTIISDGVVPPTKMLSNISEFPEPTDLYKYMCMVWPCEPDLMGLCSQSCHAAVS